MYLSDTTAVASIHWDKGMIADFRVDVNKEFGRLWAVYENLSSSHGEFRNNMQAINETLMKTQKAHEDCATLQAARLKILGKGKKCNTIV